MNSTLKTVIFWAVIVISAALLWQVVRQGDQSPQPKEISYSQFLTLVGDGKISKVTVAGNVARAQQREGSEIRVVLPANQSETLATLRQRGVEIWFKEASEQTWTNWLLNFLPIGLLAVLWFFMIRRIQRRPESSAPGNDGSSNSQPRFGP